MKPPFARMLTLLVGLVATYSPCAAAGSNTSDKDFGQAVAEVIRVPGFPRVQDIASKLRVVFDVDPVTDSPDGRPKTYHARKNPWSIQWISISDPRSRYQGVIVTFDGTTCVTAAGIAEMAGLTLTHSVPPGPDGAPGWDVMSVRVSDRRVLSFTGKDENQCLTRFDLSESPAPPTK